jgi:hypothetical protein
VGGHGEGMGDKNIFCLGLGENKKVYIIYYIYNFKFKLGEGRVGGSGAGKYLRGLGRKKY